LVIFKKRDRKDALLTTKDALLTNEGDWKSPNSVITQLFCIVLTQLRTNGTRENQPVVTTLGPVS